MDNKLEHHSVTRPIHIPTWICRNHRGWQVAAIHRGGAGGVWTINRRRHGVAVDPKTNKVAATIEVGIPGGGGEIAVE
jgi:hypothetical protein